MLSHPADTKKSQRCTQETGADGECRGYGEAIITNI